MDPDRHIRHRESFPGDQTAARRAFFAGPQPFRAVVEATASYHGLVELLEPLADRMALAPPAKLRVIAESTKKTDRRDAQVPAEFLAWDMISETCRPTPRQRQHRS